MTCTFEFTRADQNVNVNCAFYETVHVNKITIHRLILFVSIYLMQNVKCVKSPSTVVELMSLAM